MSGPFEVARSADLPVRDGVVAVSVDDEVLLVDRDAGLVVRLGADATDALNTGGTGRSEVLAALAGFGVVDGPAPAPDRRDVLRAGALGISVLALPAAAAATSPEVAGQESFALATGAVAPFDPSPFGAVNALLVQPDGGIVLGGAFQTVGGTSRNRLARVHPNGALDAAFDPNVGGTVLALALHSDGRIVVGGAFTTVGGTTRNRLARVHPNGALDALDPNLSGNVVALAIQDVDGAEHVVAGGAFVSSAGATVKRLIRIGPDGNRDATWDNIGGDVDVRALAVDGQGGVVVGGAFQRVWNEANVSSVINGVFRVDADSTLDTGFTSLAANGVPANNTVNAIAIDQQGRFLIGGTFQTTFVGGGPARSYLARIAADGTPDTDFAPSVNGAVNAITIQSDGRAIVGGVFTSIDGETRNRLARLHADTAGSSFLDTTFDPNVGGTVNALAMQDNGRIVLGGSFTTVGGQTRNRLARLD